MNVIEELDSVVEYCRLHGTERSLVFYLEKIAFPCLANYDKFLRKINTLPALHSLRRDEHVIAIANDQQRLVEGIRQASRILNARTP